MVIAMYRLRPIQLATAQSAGGALKLYESGEGRGAVNCINMSIAATAQVAEVSQKIIHWSRPKRGRGKRLKA